MLRIHFIKNIAPRRDLLTPKKDLKSVAYMCERLSHIISLRRENNAEFEWHLGEILKPVGMSHSGNRETAWATPSNATLIFWASY